MALRLRRSGQFRSVAVVVGAAYATVLLGTFFHLGAHPHVYSPTLNAFIHPEGSSSPDESDSPVSPLGSSRTKTDKSDHNLNFYDGCFLGSAVVLAIALHEQPLDMSPRPAPDVRRVSYAIAPKQSPPSA